MICYVVCCAMGCRQQLFSSNRARSVVGRALNNTSEKPETNKQVLLPQRLHAREKYIRQSR